MVTAEEFEAATRRAAGRLRGAGLGPATGWCGRPPRRWPPWRPTSVPSGPGWWWCRPTPAYTAPRAGPHRRRCPRRRRPSSSDRTRRSGCVAPSPASRGHVGPGPRSARRRPGAARRGRSRRPGPDLLHVGHHRRAQGCRADPPEPAGRHRVGRSRLADGARKTGWSTACPVFHAHGLCVGVYGTLMAGGSAVLLPGFDPAAVAAAARPSGATLFFGVPTMYHRLVSSGRAAGPRPVCGCASRAPPRCPPSSTPRPARPWLLVLERYGMTETLMNTSNPYEGERRPGTVGFPLPGRRGAARPRRARSSSGARTSSAATGDGRRPTPRRS